MKLHKTIRTWTLVLLALAVMIPSGVDAAGFSIFEQGSKAMGMAGAFTAQADDPSAMFHNAAGLAFQNERDFMLGFTYITGESDFEGADPFPGAGVTAEQETLSETPPHFYWVEPISSTMTFGLGVNSPFGLTTEWKDPDTFLGRFISTRATILAIDVNPTLAYQITPKIGFGIGAIVRFSSVEVDMRQGQTFSGVGFREIAELGLESDLDNGLGFNLGFLHRASDRFSWGLSYRSNITVEYGGSATFTQIPTGIPPIDAGVGFLLPDYPVPVTTEIEFPDVASLGFAFGLSANSLIEVDINWTGWSSFDRLIVESSVPGVGLDIPEDYEDVYNYRVGLRFGKPTSEWRFGYVYDETPQPDEAVSPLLPDAHRNGFTLGWGRTGNKYGFDLSLMYLPFEERSTSTNHNNFNGTYNTSAWLLGASFGW